MSTPRGRTGPDRWYRGGTVVAAVVAVAWAAALAVVDLHLARAGHAELVRRSAEAGEAAWVVGEAPSLAGLWPYYVDQGLRVLVAALLVAALVRRGRAVLAVVLVVVGCFALPVGRQVLLPAPLGGPEVVGSAWPWADALLVVLVLLLPGATVQAGRLRHRAPRPALVRRPDRLTVPAAAAAAVGVTAVVWLAPQAGSLAVLGPDADLLLLLPTAALVVASTWLVALSPAPVRTVARLAVGGLALSAGGFAVDARADTAMTGAVLLVGPAVLLLWPVVSRAWRRALRPAPSPAPSPGDPAPAAEVAPATAPGPDPVAEVAGTRGRRTV